MWKNGNFEEKRSFKFYQKPQDAPTWRSNHLWCSLRGSPRRTCSTESPRKLRRRRRTLSQHCSDRASKPSPTSHSRCYGKWVCWKLRFLSSWWWEPPPEKRCRRARRRRGKPPPCTWIDGDWSEWRVWKKKKRRMCWGSEVWRTTLVLGCVVLWIELIASDRTHWIVNDEIFFLFLLFEFGLVRYSDKDWKC